MDFLDPKKEKRSHITLIVGYVLVAVAIGIGTLILLFQAYGFGVTKKGQVVQNGLVFVSSQPNGGSIHFNGKLYSSKTATRALLPAGTYAVKISETGYRDWNRSITVNGGDVQRFDYPFLFPSTLQTKPVSSLTASPAMTTQSPDHRWLELMRDGSNPAFTQYDLKNTTNPTESDVTVPATAYTQTTGTQNWSAVEWASDNRHVLLLHTFMVGTAASKEYVLLDRQSPDQSINVTQTLNLNGNDSLALFNKKPNQFYDLNATTNALQKLATDNSLQTSSQDNVLAYKSYGDNMLLYVTTKPPTGKLDSGRVSVVLQIGEKSQVIRTLPANAPSYSLELTQYSGDWYVIAAASTDSGVYIYKNPQDFTSTASGAVPPVWRLLTLANPLHVSFSSNAQFLAAESGQNFVIYDAENVVTYRYTAAEPIDAPQGYASWMDGNRLTYVSGGKLEVFDYDYQNRQSLQAASPLYAPAFDPSFKDVFSVSSADASGATTLSRTLLTTTEK